MSNNILQTLRKRHDVPAYVINEVVERLLSSLIKCKSVIKCGRENHKITSCCGIEIQPFNIDSVFIKTAL